MLPALAGQKEKMPNTEKWSDHKRVIVSTVLFSGGVGASFALAATWCATAGAICLLAGLGAAIAILADGASERPGD